MLLAPERSIIREELEGNREPSFNGPPMDTGRRRGSNSRLPSLATLVSASLILVFYYCVLALNITQTKINQATKKRNSTRFTVSSRMFFCFELHRRNSLCMRILEPLKKPFIS